MGIYSDSLDYMDAWEEMIEEFHEVYTHREILNRFGYID